jgi:uncharacterized protein YjbI with pentapeptide repeats
MGPVPAFWLRASHLNTPVEFRVGESNAEGVCRVTEFICAVLETYRDACDDAEYQGTGYCVFHCPGSSKKVDFKKAVQNRLVKNTYKAFNFRGAVYPEGTSNFKEVEFGEDVSFAGATFVDADFSEAKFRGLTTSFSNAEFSGSFHTDFSNAEFSGGHTDFSEARFSGGHIDFSKTQFNGERTNFSEAQFTGIYTDFTGTAFGGEYTVFSAAQLSSDVTEFTTAKFGSAETYFVAAAFTKDVDFSSATFREKVVFAGTTAGTTAIWVFVPQQWVEFDDLRIEKPEQFTFHTVLLHPGWFINTDVRKVDFTNVKWYGMPGGAEGTLDEEIATLEQREVESHHTLLAQACRRLSANAEESREYSLANEFHYWSMDAARKGDWTFFNDLTWRDLLTWRRWPAIVKHLGLITTLYWMLSGYGVRATRAFLVLFGIWLTFTTLYVLVASSPFSPSEFWQAAAYSLTALVRLNPRPQSEELDWFQTLGTVEGILGPLQIALLALAIRRQVMR